MVLHQDLQNKMCGCRALTASSPLHPIRRKCRIGRIRDCKSQATQGLACLAQARQEAQRQVAELQEAAQAASCSHERSNPLSADAVDEGLDDLVVQRPVVGLLPGHAFPALGSGHRGCPRSKRSSAGRQGDASFQGASVTEVPGQPHAGPSQRASRRRTGVLPRGPRGRSALLAV